MPVHTPSTDMNGITSEQVAEIYQKLGELSVQSKLCLDRDIEMQATLEMIRQRVHDIVNILQPITMHETRISDLEKSEEERRNREAKAAGMRLGVGIGLTIGGGAAGAMLTKLVDLIANFHG